MTELQTTISYPLMEHFYTLQGEGFYAGQAAYFLRLGGCDVGCIWCDVKESWNAGTHPRIGLDEMISYAQQHAGKIVVVTGGEPTMYDLQPLTDAIHQADLRTHIETSGAHPLTGSWDWVTLSPKKFLQPVPENIPLANELKIVVYNKSDFKWAEQFATQVNDICRLYLQPEWDKRASITPLIIEYIQQHPQWQLSLQTHKYLDIP